MKHTVNTVVGRGVADDGVAATEGEVILTVDLVLAAVLAVGTGPDVNVRLAVVRVGL
jgi:hypothetical protein